MAYTPKYTSERLVEGLLQIDISDSTSPNSSEVLKWIEEVEKYIDEHGWGSQTVTDELIDVPQRAFLENDILPEQAETVTRDIGRIVIFPKRPIISIASLFVNEADLDEAENWKARYEGKGTNKHFIKLHAGRKKLAYGVFFHTEPPQPGYQRVKASYTWGWNVDSKILQKYATLKVAVQVLYAKMATSEPTGVTSFVGPGFTTAVMTTQYSERIERFERKIKEMEAEFPKWLDVEVL